MKNQGLPELAKKGWSKAEEKSHFGLLIDERSTMRYSWKNSDIATVDELGKQFQKIVRVTNENKFSTKREYIKSMEKFIKFTGQKFKLQALKNIQDKHVKAYAESMIQAGRSSKTIKNNLAAIRFWHNKMEHTRYELMDSVKFNKSLNLGSTPDGRADRAWSESEFSHFKAFLEQQGQEHYLNTLKAIKCTGMRLDEAVTLRTSVVIKGLKTGKLDLTNTKGGVFRQVTISSEAHSVLESLVKKAEGDYLTTPKSYVETHRIHVFKENLQEYVRLNRQYIQSDDRSKTGHNLKPGQKGALTVHGLRHTFARNLYNTLVEKGIEDEKAMQIVANQLGHGRSSVTKIYLAVV